MKTLGFRNKAEKIKWELKAFWHQKVLTQMVIINLWMSWKKSCLFFSFCSEIPYIYNQTFLGSNAHFWKENNNISMAIHRLVIVFKNGTSSTFWHDTVEGNDHKANLHQLYILSGITRQTRISWPDFTLSRPILVWHLNFHTLVWHFLDSVVLSGAIAIAISSCFVGPPTLHSAST